MDIATKLQIFADSYRENFPSEFQSIVIDGKERVVVFDLLQEAAQAIIDGKPKRGRPPMARETELEPSPAAVDSPAQ